MSFSNLLMNSHKLLILPAGIDAFDPNNCRVSTLSHVSSSVSGGLLFDDLFIKDFRLEVAAPLC